MVLYFNKKDLVAFGNYLLSEERKENLINEVNANSVTHADIENFIDKKNKRHTVVTVSVNASDIMSNQRVNRCSF